MREVAPDVASNRLDADRVVVLLLDDFHIAPQGDRNAGFEIKATRDISRAVLDQLGPNGRAAVVYSFIENKGQSFTSDRARLQASVDRFSPSGFPGTSAFERRSCSV